MKLIFRGGNEIVKYNIDRENKKLIFASSLSNYKEQKLPWWRLFDKGKEKLQEHITDQLNDEDFIKVIVAKMLEVGYKIEAKC